MTITKSYEQILTKTFYLASPIFVEGLRVKSNLYEFFWNLSKGPGAPFKLRKTAKDLSAIILKVARGFSRKGSSSCRHREGTVAARAMPSPCPPPVSLDGGPPSPCVVKWSTPCSPSPLSPPRGTLTLAPPACAELLPVRLRPPRLPVVPAAPSQTERTTTSAWSFSPSPPAESCQGRRG